MTQYLLRLTGDHQRVLTVERQQYDTVQEARDRMDRMILPYERSHKAPDIMAAILHRPDPQKDDWPLIAWRFATDRSWIYPPADPEIEEPTL